MKKPFKETLAFKLINGLGKHLPIVGDAIENITSADGGEGNVDYKKLVSQIIRIVSFGLLVWQFTKGNIPLDQILNF